MRGKKKKRGAKREREGEGKKSGFGQVVRASWKPPRGVYFILTVNQRYRTYQIMHLSLNFTFAFKSGGRKWALLAKDKDAGTTVINHHCDQSGDRAEGVSSELWGPWQKKKKKKKRGITHGKKALLGRGRKRWAYKYGLEEPGWM